MTASHLASTAGMNAWPLKPGTTLITSTSFTRSSAGNTASAGVSGLIATPTSQPASPTADASPSSVRLTLSAISAWNVSPLAPALTRSAA